MFATIFIRALRRGIELLREFGTVDPVGVLEADETARRHGAIQRAIVRHSLVAAAFGVVAWFPLLIHALRQYPIWLAELALFQLVIACFVAGFAGWVAAHTVSPSEFLTGPFGRRWLAFVGTSNVRMARLVSGTVALIAGGYVISFGWLGWYAMLR